jgi:hypothetical protein
MIGIPTRVHVYLGTQGTPRVGIPSNTFACIHTRIDLEKVNVSTKSTTGDNKHLPGVLNGTFWHSPHTLPVQHHRARDPHVLGPRGGKNCKNATIHQKNSQVSFPVCPSPPHPREHRLTATSGGTICSGRESNPGREEPYPVVRSFALAASPTTSAVMHRSYYGESFGGIYSSMA